MTAKVEAKVQTSPRTIKHGALKRRDAATQAAPQLITRETNTSSINARRSSSLSVGDLLDLNESTYSKKPSGDLLGLSGLNYGFGTPLLPTPAAMRIHEAHQAPLRNLTNTLEQVRMAESAAWDQGQRITTA